MHDILFEKQNEWAGKANSKEIFAFYAEQLGLNQEKFLEDLDSEYVKNRVRVNLESGIQARVQGTPTFFLQGEKIKNPRNYEEFSQLIFNARKDASI